MIESFKIQGFKSLVAPTAPRKVTSSSASDAEEDESVAVDLGAVNVFIGANGSGKSNLLEALGVLGAAAFGSVEAETLRYRGVRLGLPSLYKSSFRGTAFRRLITLEASGGGVMYRVALDNPISKPSAKWRINNELLSEGGKPILSRSPRACRIYSSDGKSERLIIPDTQTAAQLALARREDRPAARAFHAALQDFAIFGPTTPVLRGMSEDVARPPLGLSGSGLPQAVKELLSRDGKSFGPFEVDEIWDLIEWAESVAAAPVQQTTQSPAVSSAPVVLKFTDRYMRKERNGLSAYDASEGALYVLFMLALVAHPLSPQLVAVDNFDHALHPRLARALTKTVADQVIQEGRRQLLVTTHNPLVLDGLDLLDDRIRLFAVERTRTGTSEVKRIKVSPELMKDGASLSRLWIMGRLGGIPKSL
jgi:energy-coupling factor transporter ATP-binding protein EcfA2